MFVKVDYMIPYFLNLANRLQSPYRLVRRHYRPHPDRSSLPITDLRLFLATQRMEMVAAAGTRAA